MSNYDWLESRRRRQSLFIVEGSHEKNKLMVLLLKIFPEIDIDLNDIIIYGTNIYVLYDDIVRIYQNNWCDEDVDLPYIVSRKKGYINPMRKNDFTNIVLFFDYERHDPRFSEEKTTKMQKYFQDATDMGKLFLNYPMIESYQHLMEIPDWGYGNRSITVTLQPGHNYKNLIKDTKIAKAVNLPQKIREILSEKYNISDPALCDSCTENLLKSDCADELEKRIYENLSNILCQKMFLTARYHLTDIIQKINYLDLNITYYDYMRKLFSQIIYHNIRKANKIQGRDYEVDSDILKECFFELDLVDILLKQHNDSRDPDCGIIWVLNTSVFFVPEYNYQLLES